MDDPRSLSKSPAGAQLVACWRYRVGDYRIICKIEDRAVRILVIALGNRRQVYD